MKWPKRTPTHIQETKSWRLLASLAPDEWIVREVSERDYGIDAYIEIATPTGDITGNLISVQLKGPEQVDWKDIEWKDNGERSRIGTSPAIATATARYWLNLPVPVFLFVADLTVRDIYFISVEPQIRNHFDKLDRQDSLRFKLLEEVSLRHNGATQLISLLAARERFHPQFAVHVTNLLGSVESFGAYILENQGYDSFMEVDTERHLQLRTLYECCHMAAVVLGLEWPIESLANAYKRDRVRWKDEYCYLHEETLDGLLRELQQIFPELIRKAIKLITDTQRTYWLKRDPVLFMICASGVVEQLLQRWEQQAGGH